MKHDTDQLSALVDGELDHETRDKLLGHLAYCPDCRQIVEAERRLKAMLRGLSDLGTEPPPLRAPVERLMATLPPPATPPRSRWLGPGPMLAVEPRPPAIPVARVNPEVNTARRNARRAKYAVGLVSVTGAFFGVAFAMGGEPSEAPGPAVAPPVQQYSIDHARTSSGLPLADPAAATSVTDSMLARVASR